MSMKESVNNGIRVLIKTGLSALAGYLTARGVDVDPNFVVVVGGVAAGAVNVLLNGVSTFLATNRKVPDFLRTIVHFLWAPPSYEEKADTATA